MQSRLAAFLPTAPQPEGSSAWVRVLQRQAGQNNPATLSGFKSAQYASADGRHYNQLVFDDSPGQLRVQMASTQAASQFNLGHLIHQADNHHGSFRGQGFELRTNAWGAIRGGRGVHLSTYHSPSQQAAGDNLGGIAPARQLRHLIQHLSQLATTHHTVPLAAQEGASATSQSQLNPHQPHYAALFDSLKTTVSAHSLAQACSEAQAVSGAEAESNQTLDTNSEPAKLPHPVAHALIELTAKAGLLSASGQGQHWAAGEHISLAAGQHLQMAAQGSLRLHSGQAIGVLGGVLTCAAEGTALPAQTAAGTGLTLVAAQGKVAFEAQAGTLTLAARDDLQLHSNQHIDWAAAKKIVLQTAAGAAITIEAGGITLECPGTLTIHAGQRRFVGPTKLSTHLQTWPKTKMDQEVKVFLHNGQEATGRNYRVRFADGAVMPGQTGADGSTGLRKGNDYGQYRVQVKPGKPDKGRQ